MNEEYTILIADKNRNILEFLSREVIGEGYKVQRAGDQVELFRLLDADDTVDLVILDLDLPFTSELDILSLLLNRVPVLPVIIHTIYTEYMRHPTIQKADAFVRKQGNPGNLKKVISDVLVKHYGHPISPMENNHGVKA